MQYTQYTYRLSRIFALIAALLVAPGCSHLHVDTLDAWTPQTINTVVYSIADAPDVKADILVQEQIRALGWRMADTQNQADARIECKFVYKADLNNEGKLTRTLESVHVRILDIPTGDTQAVSDYFYAQGKENKWEEGVSAVFTGLNGDRAAPASRIVENAVDQAPLKKTDESAQSTTPRVPAETAETAPVSQRTRQQPENVSEPQSLEVSPWVPRFQGWGLEAWEVEE